MIRFVVIFSMLFLSGCLRVNTDPCPDFKRVQEDVLERSGHTIYWEAPEGERAFKACIEKVLGENLTADRAAYVALLNNRQLQATYESLGIAKADLAQAGLLMNPIFALAYRFTTQSTSSALINIGLLQNFLEALLIPLKKRSARFELESTRSMVTAQVLQVIADTKMAFYDLLAKKQIWNLQSQILLSLELSYETAKRLFEAGNLKKLDLVMYRVVYEEAKVALANVEIEILEAKERLNVLMGLWGDQIIWAAFDCLPDLKECEMSWEWVEQYAIANSLDLEIARREMGRTAAQFGVDTTRFIFPQLDLGPDAEREEGVWFVGPAIGIAIPFFDFGKANSAAAQAEISRQWNQYTALAIRIRSQARVARFRLLNAYRKSQYYQRVVIPLAEEVTANTLFQHNAMQLGVFHLLSAKQIELEKKIQGVEFLRDYWVERTALELILQGSAP
ncbi:MAG: TolC family protein [Chlamydiales bacterium]